MLYRTCRCTEWVEHMPHMPHRLTGSGHVVLEWTCLSFCCSLAKLRTNTQAPWCHGLECGTTMQSAIQRKLEVNRQTTWTQSLHIKLGDCLRADIPSRYVTKPTRSTQPCIPAGLLNKATALISWDKGRNVTSAGWQVTLCDDMLVPISVRHVCKLLYSADFTLPMTHFSFIAETALQRTLLLYETICIPWVKKPSH